MNSERLLARFLRYVAIDTTAQDGGESYPSSPGQRRLAELVARELREIQLEDVRVDEHSIVTATVPGSIDHPVPVVAFCAHLDTSPETTGANVKPQVIRDYPGGDLTLPGDPSRIIRVVHNPELDGLVGRTLITTDGTTLLGADDKAGVAVIVEAAAWLMEHPTEHGPVRLCFTCDEEIGRGVDHVDLDQLGATVCYTLDGQGSDAIDVETFSADFAEVVLRGANIHPSIAKGRMINAVRAAADFLVRLPRKTLSPESTDGRQGFLHPCEIAGGVGEMKLGILLRDFDATRLVDQAALLREAARATESEFPGLKIDVNIEREYRNMGEGLAREPRAVTYAETALARLGRTARKEIVRGGTDGSRLTEMGLPTPNLACGMHTPHSPLEWACLEEMVQAVQWVVTLAEVWAEPE